VNVAEDFEELLSDKMPDLAQQFTQSKRSLLENAFTEFVNIFFSFFVFFFKPLLHSVLIWNHVLQIL